ncbi:MAG: type II toxin-antitoxin system RelE/ParE family toxin [Planctomycetota bacterium]|jgi:proteic killer suppression protein|nr:type II toxin-antitoxin system RelE/ParE family toxin [Planctomycetota bacterium]
MIASFGCARTEAVFHNEHVKGFPTDIIRSAHRKLLRLHVAPGLNYLRVPSANRLEKLKGELAGYWSIRINDQYRIVFQWDGDAHNVRIVDYH